MNYEEAKAQGFKYVTRNQLGGECVHKTKPERKGGYWESPGWRYIQGGTGQKTSQKRNEKANRAASL